MNIYRWLKVITILGLSFLVSGIAFARSCPCELKAEKAELEAAMELIKKEYESDPSSDNLKKLTDIYATLEEISKKIEEIEVS